MKIKLVNILLVISAMFWTGCNAVQKNDDGSNRQSARSVADTFHIDSSILKETFQQEDTAYNEYLADRLKPIRENFKRINSISKWTSIEKKELDESTEGGEALFYYSNTVLEKIVTRQFGETFQQLTEYYLLNGQLSFVFEKSYKYNRPIYYDSASMKENNDKEAFDFNSSEIVEDRSYFEKGELIHQANNQDCGSPWASDYLLAEQNRIVTAFNKLKLIKKSS